MSSLEHPRITEVGRLLAENDRLQKDNDKLRAENDRLRAALASGSGDRVEELKVVVPDQFVTVVPVDDGPGS
jgi:regulator of replication initiation timing